MQITLGADPEVFFANEKHELRSAIGLIGGSKEKPRDEGNGFATLEDNVAAEFNIPPSINFTDFNYSIVKGLDLVERYAKATGLMISSKASGAFSPDQLNNPRALMFGCEPDFNAWNYAMNESPTTEDNNFRTCGGHVHVGGVEELDPHAVIRAMDLFLGVPSLVLDKDKERRKLYGKAGCFRYKPYGVEYRTLSNFWIWNTETRKWVFEATARAVSYVRNNEMIESDSDLGVLIQRSINESDESGYYRILKEVPTIKYG